CMLAGFFRMATDRRIFLAAFVLLGSACGFGQVFRRDCNSTFNTFKDCASVAHDAIAGFPILASDTAKRRPSNDWRVDAQTSQAAGADGEASETRSLPEPQGFHWGRALSESLTFLLIEQAYVVHTDFRWVVSENGKPFNHYWRDYKQSLSQWIHSGWDDGDPNWFGYIGHPIQGALTGFIQIQNDPRAEGLEFSNTKAYWWSRFKAGLWNAAYSTQWNLGPLSEVTVEKYGSKDRLPWTHAGTFPCSRNCYTGVGQIDIVMTPLGGMGWLIGEDILDKKVVRRVEDATQNHFLIDTARVALNPLRAGANMLHGNHPWYRASRGAPGLAFVDERKSTASTTETLRAEIPNARVLNHGDLFFGYSNLGAVHCEVVASGKGTPCDPFSSKVAHLGGWTASAEKMYLRYFGFVADFRGEYGGVSQTNFLFGLRGGAAAARFRPFAQALIGAARSQGGGSASLESGTFFAEDLGVGIDWGLTHRLGWRNQVDVIKTGSPDFQRRNLHASSGVVVR